jgi:hypothetical protein
MHQPCFVKSIASQYAQIESVESKDGAMAREAADGALDDEAAL